VARGINLTLDQIAEIRKLKKAGKLTVQEIGDRFGVTRSIISKHAGDIKSNPEVSSRKTPKATISKIRGLKLAGVEIKDIAKRLGVSEKTVSIHTTDIKGDIGAANRKYTSQEVADWHNEKYGTNLEADDVGRSHRTKYSRAQPGGRATSAAHSASRRATILAATPAESKLAPFVAEIKGLYHAAEVIPGGFEVDHIERLIDDGLHHPKNLQLLKYEVHRLKTALENAGKFREAARVGQFNEYNLEPKLRSLLAENVKAPGLMSFLKPALKVGAKALPFIGYGAGAWGAEDYAKSGNPILSAISGASAIPGFGDVFGIPLAIAELIGLGVNRDRELIRKREEERGLLNYEPPKRKPGRGYGLLNN